MIVWLLQLVFPITETLSLQKSTFREQPWSIFTTMFTHSLHPLHIFMNMLSLWFMGREIELRYPSKWFTTTYLVGGLVGSLVWLLVGPDTPVVGASGAIFALLGLALPLTRFHSSVIFLATFNIILGFIVPNVAWQVHLGGFFTGLVFGLIFAKYILSHNKKLLKVEGNLTLK